MSLSMRAVLLAAGLVALAGPCVQAAPLNDGPYVVADGAGGWLARWVQGEEAAPRVVEKRVRVGERVAVPAVGSLPAFEVVLRGTEAAAADEVALAPDGRLFVVADSHGQFGILVRLLQTHRVIDRKLRWSFGRGHLAILGDVFDRGPNQTEIFWLIYKLEAEAAKAGGGVHLVLGNHETRSLLGDQRDLHARYARVMQALGTPAYADLWSDTTLLGQWLRTKPAVKKMGSWLCLHGGISRELVDRGLTLRELNQTVRDVLNKTSPLPQPPQVTSTQVQEAYLTRDPQASDEERERARFLMGKTGPLWYRGYFEEAAIEGGYPIATQEDVDLATARYGVKSMLVGHTMVEAVQPLYQGKVFAVQVKMHIDDLTRAPIAQALLIEDRRYLKASIDGSLEILPGPRVQ